LLGFSTSGGSTQPNDTSDNKDSNSTVHISCAIYGFAYFIYLYSEMRNSVNAGKHWTVRDRYGNNIYLTNEWWKHIIDPVNHPEMSNFDYHLKETIRSGVRKQDKLNPQKYRYVMPFSNLTENNTHIVAQCCLDLEQITWVTLFQTIIL